MSQNFDIGLSFCVMLCRRWDFEKIGKKYEKLPVFCHKNVFHAWLKADTCKSNIRRDIHVQKIKVEKSLINSLLLMYKYFCHVPYTIR